MFFTFVSCSDSIERIVPVDGEVSSDTPEKSDDDAFVPEEEDIDPDEVQDTENPVKPDDQPEIPDEETAPDNEQEADSDELFSDEDNVQELPEETELPVCGEVFNGSNCAASSCETAEDCCEADLCVATDGCGGGKVCRNAFFKENFDSYIAGFFPKEKWILKYNGMGDDYQIVTSEDYVSPENSMHLLGRKGTRPNDGGWAAIMTGVLPQVPEVVNVELKMKTAGDDVYFALCTFDGPGTWGNFDVKLTFVDGKISYQIPEWTAYEVEPSYEPNQWYKIRLKLDQANKTVSVWVDDELMVAGRSFNADSLLIPNLCLSSNKQNNSVWFDDIFVWGE